jgi:hypothetical protein
MNAIDAWIVFIAGVTLTCVGLFIGIIASMRNPCSKH